ncbi:MAG: prolyl oligopeptidase family serine peptidase [Verrucomicrobia bacterium]|nr:prolyl oligopeptidase family serine peptidase [Verrucomicrobiota bacterium]
MKTLHHLTFVAALVFLLLTNSVSRAADHNTGPWDLTDLSKAPTVEWIDQSEPIRSLYYSGENYQGKKTRVFAYYGIPEGASADNKKPAMVLVHGGGGAAFKEWVEIWVKRGYVAIAMDLAGKGEGRKVLPDGGPDQTHKEKFTDLAGGVKTAWTYHAVANILRAVSLLQNQPEVDPEKIGMTGISWGGYLTSLASGLDPRLKVTVPVYGCGFLHENSTWLKGFEALGPKLAAQWVKNFDPSSYLQQAQMPMLFVNGANDFAYPLDSYQKTYQAVKGPRTLCVTVRMPHGHSPGWAPREIGLFVDSVLINGKTLIKIGEVSRNEKQVAVNFQSEMPIKSAALHYTTDTGPWKDRLWKSADAAVKDNSASATLPALKDVTWFFTITDERGATVSSEHQTITHP